MLYHECFISNVFHFTAWAFKALPLKGKSGRHFSSVLLIYSVNADLIKFRKRHINPHCYYCGKLCQHFSPCRSDASPWLLALSACETLHVQKWCIGGTLCVQNLNIRLPIEPRRAGTESREVFNTVWGRTKCFH